jgi:hypothetical protein
MASSPQPSPPEEAREQPQRGSFRPKPPACGLCFRSRRLHNETDFPNTFLDLAPHVAEGGLSI